MIINYYESTKSYTALLLSVFDNIQIDRNDGPYTVPIKFAKKSRLIKKLEYEARDSAGERSTYSHLVPIMSLDVTGLERNAIRQTNHLLKTGRVHVQDDQGNYDYTILTWNDTPTDFLYELTVYSKTITELSNLIEYIISKFKYSLYYVDYNSPIYVKPISTPIELETTNIDIENNEDMYEEDRLVSASLSLRVKGIVHNNIQPQTDRIERIEFNLNHYNEQVNTLLEQYIIE